jgi:hypothetical protein
MLFMDEAEALVGVQKILRFRNRTNMADLLERAQLELEVSNQYGSRLFSQLTQARIHVPLPEYEKLRALSKSEQEELYRALTEIYPTRDRSIEIASFEFVVDTTTPTDDTDELISEIEAQRALMISVSTGGPKIQSVNRQYQERRAKIETMLNSRGVVEPNLFRDLWMWYGKWSSGDLPSYQSRRAFIGNLYDPLIQHLRSDNKSKAIFESPTGWAKVDRTITEIRLRLETAKAEEQFQAVGLLCREALITLAQTVFNPNRHPILDGVDVSKTDGKRMLEAYLTMELSGGENKIARQHAKAALDLANETQHRRTAGFRQAALCAESTTAVINLIAIISGQRDPR